jgi:4-amino-4-deoxy-L-arabinose transferase-like glycosyltransferase
MPTQTGGPFGFCLSGNDIGWRGYAFLVLLCLSFFVPGLASLPPTDRDESLFAQASKQMIETQDYVNINYLGSPRHKKPVGIYWLQAASVQLLNPHHLNEIWAYRLPSLLGATMAVLMTAALGALLFNATVGLGAAVMLASCLDLNIEAHLAKTDAALLATVMLAQYALARAYLLPQAAWKNAAVFWSALAAGILIKGPIVVLTLFSTLLWLRLTEKNLDWFKRLKPIVGLPYALALIAPWFIAINLASHGQFAAQSGGHDFLAKLWQGQDRGFLPPGLHALVFPAMFFPFSLFALLAIPDAWAARRDRAVRFCLGWIVPTWIVFELSLTKLPHYVLPVYPAIAILTAKFFFDGFPAISASTRRLLPTVAVSLWIILGAALAIAFSLLPFIVDRAINPLQIVGSGILLIAQGTGLLFFLQRKKMESIAALTLGMLVFSGIAFGATLPDLKRLWVAREIVQQARLIAPCPRLEIVSAGFAEPSLAFLAGTSTKLAPSGTFAAAEMQHDLCRVGVIHQVFLKNFLEASQDFPTQPYPVGEKIDGINTGHGSATELSLYLMPQTREATPVYP